MQSVEILVGSAEFLLEHGVAGQFLSASDADQTASTVFVARSGRLLGAILIADAVRPEAPDAMRQLRALSIKTILLTGDTKAAADATARQVGVDEVDANLLPDQKVERIRRLAGEGRVVAMVGDGINDAPALVQASVGVAMGSGTDVARESADIVLLGNDLSKFVQTVRLAKRTKRIISFNFAGTIVVDGIGIGLAAAGLLNPLLAAFIHVTSELTFILNSARLLPTTSRSRARRDL